MGNLTVGKITEIIIPIIRLLNLKFEVNKHQMINLKRSWDIYLIVFNIFIVFLNRLDSQEEEPQLQKAHQLYL